MTPLNSVAPLLGRIMIALVFLLSGIMKAVNFTLTADQMAAKGIPAVETLLMLSIVIEIVASLMIISGFKARWGALTLLLWMIPVNILYHNFWAMEGSEQFLHRIMFLKNISLMGAMVYIISYGPGTKSIKE
jgi:putative oxidoreductase